MNHPVSNQDTKVQFSVSPFCLVGPIEKSEDAKF